MGKVHFEWVEGQLVISQCDKMKTDPTCCNACKNRFQCFTERVKHNPVKVKSGEIPRLSDLLKVVDDIGNTD
jgi:hypothetical protein